MSDLVISTVWGEYFRDHWPRCNWTVLYLLCVVAPLTGCFPHSGPVIQTELPGGFHLMRTGTLFGNGLWAHNWNLVTILFKRSMSSWIKSCDNSLLLILYLIFQSSHNFALVKVAPRSPCVQNWDLIWSVLVMQNQHMFLEGLDYELKNCCWDRCR